MKTNDLLIYIQTKTKIFLFLVTTNLQKKKEGFLYKDYSHAKAIKNDFIKQKKENIVVYLN